jgi:4-aminobutyrate aminotransferase-like enzyme
VVVDEVKVGIGCSRLLHCFEHEGLEPDLVLFGYVGFKAKVVEITPPLTMTEEEALLGAAIVGQALADVEAGLVSDADVAPFMMW